MQTETFQTNVDSWIKEINGRVSKSEEANKILTENQGNIEHNYELIHELRDTVEELKAEIRKLKLIQLYTLKKKVPELQH
jgi:H2-forming N5,N10-methylenetetrahydromethanopterin dehydrogenase-like enzyme|tara:strand:+ start:92 stop:331 length:240 start_codon:yes stop_codon:yes gene_type:complete